MALEHYEMKYRIVSVKRFPELQQDLDQLFDGNKLSTNSVYRSYIDPKKFTVPETFSNAKSVIILAKATRIAFINFHYYGQVHNLLLPSPYYDDGSKIEDIEDYIFNEIFHSSRSESLYKIERTKNLFLKTLAVRSGLAKYGRNNISYVTEFGSFFDLYSFFTDFIPSKYDWSERKLMDLCESCTICTNLCPTKAIRNNEFVIDVERCLSLYNEVKGDFPPDFPTHIHHALMGCIKCQYSCPANKNAITNTRQLEPITEEETQMVLEGRRNDALVHSLCMKLKMFPFEYYDRYLPVLRRNLSVLIK